MSQTIVWTWDEQEYAQQTEQFDIRVNRLAARGPQGLPGATGPQGPQGPAGSADLYLTASTGVALTGLDQTIEITGGHLRVISSPIAAACTITLGVDDRPRQMDWIAIRNDVPQAYDINIVNAGPNGIADTDPYCWKIPAGYRMMLIYVVKAVLPPVNWAPMDGGRTYLAVAS